MSVSRRGLKMPEIHVTSGSVKAGVLAASTYPAQTITNAATGAKMADPRAGMHVATIAAALEYGTRQSHPRPFMQQTVGAQKDAWCDGIVKLLVAGETSASALGLIGEVMRDDIAETITSWPADNSPEWAAFKGFSAGLRFMGDLLRSVDYEVEQ
jgi:hypothetical protein